ncbi:sulfonate ABC transporter substrate-binding protein [Alsobacter soli]|uniref:Sulfonate ABC transporter substrate-binding protein n=1 Tax=Alsobacter soli TaxID=2109933 RepID=A0A2T1HY38_9HYPH|nr:ABC transporter substrate-binding protein [Alsobacter soli]PSC06613.1 sulfonate ABC transporter substrate-binding protein [Alsobacter soli]
MRRISLGVVAAMLLAAAPAAAADKVTFRLNWIAYGFHTPFYLGLERGYYKDEGIDLTIGEGQGSVRAVQTVGAKGDTFGLADGGSVVAGVSKGAPVRAVMAITSSSPYALSARADAGVRTLKDIEGKTVASAPGEAGLQLLPALFARNGVDASKVKILRVEGAGKMVAVAEKKAEALMAGLDNQSITLPRQGVPLVDFGYAANGVNTMGLTIIANEDTIKSNPDLVRRFVKATARSFEAALKEPEASVKAGQKVKPDMEADLAMAQLKAGVALMNSEASKSLPLGQFALKDWQDTIDLMKQYQDLQTDKPADAFFTNAFAGKGGS